MAVYGTNQYSFTKTQIDPAADSIWSCTYVILDWIQSKTAINVCDILHYQLSTTNLELHSPAEFKSHIKFNYEAIKFETLTEKPTAVQIMTRYKTVTETVLKITEKPQNITLCKLAPATFYSTVLLWSQFIIIQIDCSFCFAHTTLSLNYEIG